jgi:photosynthetic reaction center cytochrome c subunit
MTVGRRTMMAAASTAGAWALAVAMVSGQAATDQKPVLAEEVFKNVQVLKGITVNEFMGTMGIFSAALGMSCEDCHKADDSDWANFAIDNPRKRMARAMVTMMGGINKTNFGGRQMITCFTCHRGADKPRTTPNVALLYGTPPPEDTTDVIVQAKNAPMPEQVLDKYVQAIGGAQRVAAITSLTAKGVSIGYGPEAERRPVEIYAKAPAQRTTIIHTADGDSVTTFDGRTAWISAPHRPVDVLALTGPDFDGAKIDVDLTFPARIKESLTKWRTAMPAFVDGRELNVVQGTGANGATVTLYFDAESGLLVRQIRYVDSPVGRMPTQMDYSDYRDVSGVKMPFKWTHTWLDGRDSYELAEVRANAAVDAAKFAKPKAPVVPKTN